MNTIRLCSGCGAPLTPDAPAGLCPQCLLKSDAGSHLDGGAAAAHAVPFPGREFGNYRILRLLGHGGMGEVFEAENIASGRRVALKVMRHGLASEQDRKRFLREGRLAASVNHRNVVYIHGSEEIDGAPAIAMELVHGGTLKDRLKREGPLPIADAIQAALQIIEGLEAAHAAGVLHRDIKPANCFVAADGTVKVGDFGLSVSTLARSESLLTATGAVMGTPAYASPEQLRGEELDVRSDIYSVGATLYHLLTGRTPFAATDFVKLITEVLDKQPDAPRNVREEMPQELSKVILRCLAKDRDARFQTYEGLRDALLPFAAGEVVPAKPAMRFLAALIDEGIAFGPSWVFLTYWSLDPLDKLAHERTLHAFLVWLPFFAWYSLYYAISEGLWGAAVGKSICRLRVVSRAQQPPGIARALVRVLVYSIPVLLPSFALMALVPLARLSMTSEPQEWLTGRDGSAITDWAWLPLMILLFVTMRARNGYAALQDLISGTRVIVRPKLQPRPSLAIEPTALPERNPALPGYGPYESLAALGATSEGELLLAQDATLQRRIWIHLRPEGSAPVTEARRDLSRPARLRWIQGGETTTHAWDAYEALIGAPFLKVIERPQSWAAVRFWLLDLAEELSAGLDHPQTSTGVSLDRIWVTASGRAVILDFPAPGTAAGDAAILRDKKSAQLFLSEVARLALEGSTRKERQPAAPVPVHAQGFLASLARGAFEELRFVVGNLQSLIAKPAEITRGRRAVSLAFVPLVTLFVAVTLAGVISFERIRWERAWTSAHPNLPSLRSAANILQFRQKTAEFGARHADDFEKIGVFISARYGELITNSAFWASPAGQLIAVDDRRALMEAVEKFPDPSPAQIARAERSIPRRLAEHEREQRALAIQTAGGMCLVIPALAAIVDLLGALAFGSSPLMRLFGMTAVNGAGRPAGRWQLATRSLVVWMPTLIALSLAVGLLSYAADHSSGWAGLSALLVAIAAVSMVAGFMIQALVWPTRSLADMVVRTRLVPL